VLWIFDKCLLKDNVSAFLRKAHEYYFGIVYFFNHTLSGSDHLFPVHFNRYGRYLVDEYGNDYFKNYKVKRESVFGKDILDFRLLKTVNNFRDNNVLIARFYDTYQKAYKCTLNS
jgi:hypothetical protein